jgi:hypothetical protein
VSHEHEHEQAQAQAHEHEHEHEQAIRAPQDRESPVRAGVGGGFAWRYAYARAADSIAMDDRGQDYLTLRWADGVVAFSLCDGVSLSFYGDLAARLLGDELVRWLWDHLPPDADAGAIRAALMADLIALTAPATEAVQALELPPSLAPLLRAVLEEKRRAGSESTFVCGRLDLPSAAFPAGRAVLAWMGDTRLRFWGPDGERTVELGDSFQTAQRWSSCRGPVNGEVNVFAATVERDGQRALTRLLAYSDGLAALDPLAMPPSNVELTDSIDQAGRSAASDDVAVLDLCLQTPSTPPPERSAPCNG